MQIQKRRSLAGSRAHPCLSECSRAGRSSQRDVYSESSDYDRGMTSCIGRSCLLIGSLQAPVLCWNAGVSAVTTLFLHRCRASTAGRVYLLQSLKLTFLSSSGLLYIPIGSGAQHEHPDSVWKHPCQHHRD